LPVIVATALRCRLKLQPSSVSTKDKSGNGYKRRHQDKTGTACCSDQNN
jgi:hypothetical protein